MLNRSGNTMDNLCFRYRFRDVFSRFRCWVYNGTGPLFVHVKHNENMELHVSATFQKWKHVISSCETSCAIFLYSDISVCDKCLVHRRRIAVIILKVQFNFFKHENTATISRYYSY